MKKLIKFFQLTVLAALIFTACDNDPVGEAPLGESITSEISASPGDEITFKGTFITESQFASITLHNETLLLDKEIVFANVVSKYYLEYNFKLPDDIPFDTYIVKILAESVDGAKEEFDVTVSITSVPEATGLSLNISASPGDEIVLTGNITDAQGLQSIALQNAGIGLDDLIELQDTPNEYTLEYLYTVPSDADLLVHKGNIIVTNVAGRSVTYNLEVNLTGQEITYSQVFIAGGFQWWTWNAEHAYMMLPDPNDEKWFEVDVHAWPEDGYNEVKFLGQLAWTPDNWGLVDNTDPGAGMLNDENSQPVLLDAAGSSFYPSYFKLRFNPSAKNK